MSSTNNKWTQEIRDTVIEQKQCYKNRISKHLEYAVSENSRLALQSDIQHFKNWGGDIPATIEQVTMYLSDHAEHHSMATLKRRLASLSKVHNMKGWENPVKSEMVKMMVRGIARQYGKPQYQVKPLLKEDLIAMLAYTNDKPKGLRDRALLLIGFSAALRRSELCAIKLDDLEQVDRGLVLTLPRSKTDQLGQGRKIGIPYGRGHICPVKAVQEWIEALGDVEYLFPAITKGGTIKQGHVSDRAVADIIKHYAKKAGLEHERYSGHSLRAGLATSAAMNGVSTHKIRQQTGHKSDAMLSKYIRDGDLFTDNAVGYLF